MVAPQKTRRVVCTVVRVPGEHDLRAARFDSRPSALLPWADPYIAGLVRRLQSEIRFERASLAAPTVDAAHSGLAEPCTWRQREECLASLTADLEPPTPDLESDWDWWDHPRWTIDDEPLDESSP